MPLGSLEFGLLLMDAEWRKDAGTEASRCCGESCHPAVLQGCRYLLLHVSCTQVPHGSARQQARLYQMMKTIAGYDE